MTLVATVGVRFLPGFRNEPVPSTKRHAINEEGDCAEWCHACRENRERGLNPDGTAQEPADA